MSRRDEVTQWLESAPKNVKWLFNHIAVINFWKEHRNHCFQAQGMYDGSISEEAKALFQEHYEACDAIFQFAKRTHP